MNFETNNRQQSALFNHNLSSSTNFTIRVFCSLRCDWFSFVVTVSAGLHVFYRARNPLMLIHSFGRCISKKLPVAARTRNFSALVPSGKQNRTRQKNLLVPAPQLTPIFSREPVCQFFEKDDSGKFSNYHARSHAPVFFTCPFRRTRRHCVVEREIAIQTLHHAQVCNALTAVAF